MICFFLGGRGWGVFLFASAFKSFILKLDMVTSIFLNLFVQENHAGKQSSSCLPTLYPVCLSCITQPAGNAGRQLPLIALADTETHNTPPLPPPPKMVVIPSMGEYAIYKYICAFWLLHWKYYY